MRIRSFQAIYPNSDFISSADSFFDRVKFEYADYSKAGMFNKSAQEAMYIYQIKRSGKTHTGIIVTTDIHDYIEGNIKKHEHTLITAEQMQMQLMLSRSSAIKPVLLAYKTQDIISKWIYDFIQHHKPFFTIHFDNNKSDHLLWEVSEGAQIQELTQLFHDYVPESYIADGHHRSSSTALLYERMKGKKTGKEFDQLLVALFASDELEINEFNRIIHGLNEMSSATYMALLSKVADIEVLKEARKPKKKFEITMHLNKEWYSLTWKKSVIDEYQKKGVVLDVTLLNEKIMKEILGIEKVRNDGRVEYVEGPKGLDALRSHEHDTISFCMYPVELKDLMDISDEGGSMPPKSTFFEPRLKNGLMVYEL